MSRDKTQDRGASPRSAALPGYAALIEKVFQVECGSTGPGISIDFWLPGLFVKFELFADGSGYVVEWDDETDRFPRGPHAALARFDSLEEAIRWLERAA